ncbi:MAG: hypothetical protein JWN70_2429 [Planctomycetaceae bacterium]|nr:hypothetical protein [Planctomycetaceae bacterium]
MWPKCRSKIVWCVVAVGLLAGAGCGGGDGIPQVYPVSGVVTRNGTPLANANVEFIPAKGRPSSATTDQDGNFVLEYQAKVPGALPGEHLVVVAERFQGASADGPAAPRTPAAMPREPQTYRLSKPLHVEENENSFQIDVSAGTATASN